MGTFLAFSKAWTGKADSSPGTSLAAARAWMALGMSFSFALIPFTPCPALLPARQPLAEWLLRLGLPRSALALGSSGSACFGDKRCCVLPAVQLLPCRPGIALSPFRLVTKHLQGRGVEKSRDFCKQIVLLCYTESIVLIFLLCVVPQSSEASPDPAECVGLVARGVAVTPTPCAVHAALGTSMAELWGCC